MILFEIQWDLYFTLSFESSYFCSYADAIVLMVQFNGLEIGNFLMINFLTRAQEGLYFNINGLLVVQSLHPTRWPEAMSGTSCTNQCSKRSAAMTIFTANVHVGNQRLFRVVMILQNAVINALCRVLRMKTRRRTL